MEVKDLQLTKSDLQEFLNAKGKKQMQILLAHAERNQELIRRTTVRKDESVDHKEEK